MSMNAEKALKIALDAGVEISVRNTILRISSPVSPEVRQMLMRYAAEYIVAAKYGPMVRCVGCRHYRKCKGVCRYE